MNPAIELDPEVGEYYYLRYSMGRLESDLARAIELDPAIAEAMRDRRRAMEEEPTIPDILPAFSWDEFLANRPKPMIIKEPWRLKRLRD